MQKSALISSILEKNPVVEYLAARGHDPMRSYGARHVYSCPLHGPEKDPSFYVFTDKEFQYYHCFGCRAHGDIINLVAALENLEIKKAIGRLAFGLNITEQEVIDRLAEDIENSKSKTDIGLEDIAIRLACTFRSFLEEVNKDPVEVAFMEQVFRNVDRLIAAMDVDELRKVYDIIVDQGIPKRVADYAARKEQEAAQRFVSKSYAS